MADVEKENEKWTGPSSLYEEQVNKSRILTGDLTFNELVKLDARSLQNVCRLNKYYGEFCIRDNKDFWRAKVRYEYRLLGIDYNDPKAVCRAT
jgi:hypothetical protein